MSNLRKNFDNILTLVKVAGTIDGRIKFQKIVYILQTKGIAFNEQFKYHYYGPYSPVLQLEIEELVDRKILKEEKSSNSYTYKLNPSETTDFELNSDLESKQDLINFLKEQTPNQLELVSTIFFLEKAGPDDETIIHKRIAFLKPHLKDIIEAAFTIKNKLTNY